MTATDVSVFLLVHLGMILGGLPFVQLHSIGVALLGAIALVGTGVVTPRRPRNPCTCRRRSCCSRSGCSKGAIRANSIESIPERD